MEDKKSSESKEARRKWAREYQRRWREKNPYRAKMTAGKYQEEHREQINRRHRAWKYKKGRGFPNQWIRVDEFLPDEGIPVLAHIKYTEEYFPGEDYGILIWDGKTWRGVEWYDAPVTHWTRLPPEPKAE